MNVKIDIHDRQKKYNMGLKYFKADKSIHPTNKKHILEFLEDCKKGKTITHRAKKKIEIGSRLNILVALKVMLRIFNKPIGILTQKEFEEGYFAFDDDKVGYKTERLDKTDKKKQKLIVTNVKYKNSTKTKYKVVLRKFLNWYRSKYSLDLDFSFIEIINEPTEIPAISIEELNKMILRTGSIRDKCILQVLFDGGFRIEELLNVRLNNVSKNKEYYKIRIEVSKTKPRTITLPLSTELLDAWLQEHPTKDKPESQLFPLSYDGVNKMVKRLSLKVLKRKVTPHILRHSSATYYCSKLGYFQLCKRYGWSMSSKMPQTYIDQAGIDEEETAEIVRGDRIKDLEEKNNKLNEDMDIIKSQLNRVAEYSEVMNKVVKHPKFRDIIKDLKIKPIK